MSEPPASVPLSPECSAADSSPNKAVLLLYHRVTELPTDPQSLCVAASHFAEQLQILRKQFNVMSLGQMIRAMDRGHIPARSAVVTFDDGYADNLHNAKPLLECQGLPATVFVVSGALGSSREFWWDELDRLLLQSGSLPASLHLTIAGVPHEWHLGDSADLDSSALARFRAWNVLEKTDPTPRHTAYRELCHLLHSLPHAQRQHALDELTRWTNMETAGRSTHRALTPQELQQLAEGGRIEVGAHTASHLVLSTLRADAGEGHPQSGPPSGSALAEIRESKNELENILGRPVTSFSYPYGQRADYTPETVDCVRACGFACACSAFGGFVHPDSDRFRLPRMIVRNWDGDAFTRRLERWWPHA
jgi:peptidoglycan/xylan/chitin deacetylase (PgdA/CDA1 family)